MISFRKEDIFSLAPDVDAMVNSVNCKGVMGRGLALQFKERFPENFQAYQERCHDGSMKPGDLFVHENKGEGPRYIINFATRDHWKDNSRLEYLERGLTTLAKLIRYLKTDDAWLGINSIAIPALGCGLGKLKWPTVRKLIELHLKDVEGVDVTVLEPR
ncbi:MAG: macro domain-containing protein [Gemmatimonadetes bacterium]|nr:macro domain-containing protein [Gemmatimonadota bacterium]